MHRFTNTATVPDTDGKQLSRIIRLSFLDAGFYSCMVGCGETYIVAFALALGFASHTAGLTAIMPLVVGALLQPIIGRTLHKRISARSWSVTCCVLQSLALFTLAAGGFFFRDTPKILLPGFFAVVTWYWTVALSISPVWNVWIGRLVPADKHLDFFVKRTRIIQAGMVTSLIVAGSYLRWMEIGGTNIGIFALIFVLAGVLRLISAWCLWLHPDAPVGEAAAAARPKEKLRDKFSWALGYPAAMMLTFSFLTNLAVYFSSPFFTPFMLRHLKLDYGIYAALTSLAFISRVLTANLMASVGSRFGVRMLLVLGSVGIVPVAWMWVVSNSLAYLVFVQFLTGFVWGCHELGITLYLMETVTDQKRLKLLSFMQITTAFGMLTGSMFGTLFVAGKQLDTPTYYEIFTMSSLLRTLPALVLILWTPKLIAIARVAWGHKRQPVCKRDMSLLAGVCATNEPASLIEEKEARTG